MSSRKTPTKAGHRQDEDLLVCIVLVGIAQLLLDDQGLRARGDHVALGHDDAQLGGEDAGVRHAKEGGLAHGELEAGALALEAHVGARDLVVEDGGLGLQDGEHLFAK